MVTGEQVPKRLKRGTIKEVAAAAGVHPSTVSRSLDRAQASKVNEETRRRVLEAAAALNYRPDLIASGLRRQRTMTVGVLIPDFGNPIHAHLVHGISRRLELDGYTAVLLETEDDHERFVAAIDILTGRQVDAVICAAARQQDSKALRRLARSGIPVVMAIRWVRGMDIPIVANDDFRGGVMATEHLIELGHRRLAELHGPVDIEAFVERSRGFHIVLAQAGLAAVPSPAQAVLPSVDEGRRLMRSLMDQVDRPTAVFAHNDLMAIGAIEVLEELGLSCPRDVSIVGYNDIPLTEHLAPPLTTVRMPTGEVGRFAAETALGLINGYETASTLSISLQPQLIIRGSTAAPYNGR